MNKRASLIVVSVGAFFFIFGSLLLMHTVLFDNHSKVIVKVDASPEDKKEIQAYLKDRYGEDFEVVEYTTSFCVVQNEENNSFYLDSSCKVDDIRDDIYKVVDKDNISFYVKKVTLKDGVKLINELEKSHSNTFYDNYIVYVSVNKLSEEIIDDFKIFGEVTSIEVINGLGVEKPQFEMENGNYLYYYLYSDLDSDLISSANKYMTLREYIDFLTVIGKRSNVDLYVKLNSALTAENFQEVVSLMGSSNLINISYGIMADSIVLEFNNGIYLKYSSDFMIKVFNEYDYLFENSAKLAYPNGITFNSTVRGDNIISYDDFLRLEKSEFNF